MIDRFEQFVSYISAIHRDVQKIERDEMVKYGLKGAYAQYLGNPLIWDTDCHAGASPAWQ